MLERLLNALLAVLCFTGAVFVWVKVVEETTGPLF